MNNDATKRIRENYDHLAEDYARHLFDELSHKPFDRNLLTHFAAEVAGRGEVCDMGCGPGHVARHLRDAGATVFGLDISPEMLKQGRRLNPDIPFREGNMLALDLPDQSLAGIAAFYAIVNFPEEFLPQIFREMARVLKPSGLLLLSFHVGTEVVTPKELWGVPHLTRFLLLSAIACPKTPGRRRPHRRRNHRARPYPEVEYQSRRAYIFTRKPHSVTRP